MLLKEDLWPGCKAFYDAVAGAMLELSPDAQQQFADAVVARSNTVNADVGHRLGMYAFRLQGSLTEIATNQQTRWSPDYSESSSRPLSRNEWQPLEVLFEIVGEFPLNSDSVLGRHLAARYDSLSDQRQRESFVRLQAALRSIRQASVR